ncbi:18922_t:CDS:2 [Racocetra fulgida]|uniref:18922_t:CDS:1 n=1 Tax=Racocetra fulgida TaxID=60492 RepID=A0A9N9F9E2_9GLOM|nr:18922_t:CDS:2 [Racocetra fulgida]
MEPNQRLLEINPNDLIECDISELIEKYQLNNTPTIQIENIEHNESNEDNSKYLK